MNDERVGNRTGWATIVVLVLLAGSAAATPDDSDPPAPIWVVRTTSASRGSAVVRAQPIDIDAAAIDDARVGDTVLLELFDDRVVTGMVERRRDVAPRRTTLRGRLQGNASGTFTVCVRDAGVAGLVSMGAAGTYRIRGAADGSLRLESLDETAIPCELEAEPRLDPGRRRAPRPRFGTDGLCDDGSRIDVLVVYTTKARDQAGGTDNLLAEIDLMIEYMSTSLENSDVATRAHLVYARELGAPEELVNLAAVFDPDDGIADGVHVLRDAYAADQVALVRSGSGGGAYGLRNLDPESEAFAFCSNGRESLPFILAHEVGHNLGCCHAHGDYGGCFGEGLLFPFSNGYRFVGDSGTEWRTVMAYAPGIGRAFYSNPRLEFDGVPTGIPGTDEEAADNARTIDLAASTVANWRRRDSTCEDLDLPSTGDDCNENDVPDRCEIARGLVKDLDRDGIPDECQCSGDIDRSGTVDVADLIQVLTAWGATGGPEDLDESGVVDFGDVIVVLTAWGPCAPPDGACCLPDGVCTPETPEACIEAGGTYLGDGASCAECPAGACCLPGDACCAIEVETVCLSVGGEYRGDGTTCRDECPLGACCFDDGGCSQQTPDVCAASGGLFIGASTLCIDVCLFGACCRTDGSCSETTQVGCLAEGGSFAGADSTCVDGRCQPVDRCEDAWVAGEGAYLFSTLSASTDGDALPQSCDEGNGVILRKDVWVRFTPSCDGTATARVCDSDFDTRLAVYAGGDCSGPLLACSDDACGEDGTRSEVIFTVTKGEPYLVRIGGRAERGSGVLELECSSATGPEFPVDRADLPKLAPYRPAVSSLQSSP